MYRARRTLVVKFDNDAIDESEDVREASAAAVAAAEHSTPQYTLLLTVVSVYCITLCWHKYYTVTR
jgi:hypothetical protein